jgi:hypothetical protein
MYTPCERASLGQSREEIMRIHSMYQSMFPRGSMAIQRYIPCCCFCLFMCQCADPARLLIVCKNIPQLIFSGLRPTFTFKLINTQYFPSSFIYSSSSFMSTKISRFGFRNNFLKNLVTLASGEVFWLKTKYLQHKQHGKKYQ